MRQQHVELVSPGQFRVWWDGYEDQALLLNFNPLIATFNLTGAFCLIHWQARPKGLRRWGVYDHLAGMYYPMDYNQFNRCKVIMQFLQIPDGTSLPSAAIAVDGTFNPTTQRIHR